MRLAVLLLSTIAFAPAAEIFHGSPGATRKPDQTIPGAAPAAITALSYSDDAGTLTITSGGKSIPIATGSTTRNPVTTPPPLARCAGAQQVQLLDTPAGEPRQTYIFPGAGPCVAAASRDGKWLAAAKNGLVRIWNVGGGDPPRDWTAHARPVHALAFSTDATQLASAGADGTIKVWDIATGELLSTLAGHTGAVLAVAFSPNGRTIVSGGEDRALRYWTTPLPPIPPEDVRKIQAAIPAKAAAAPKKPRKVLVFWRADAIQHKNGVPAANLAIALLAQKTGAFQADFSRDYDVLDPAVLSRYDAILMNSTAHLAIPGESGKQAFLDYARNGGGVIGIHAAIDTFKDWPAGAEVVGATFAGHPFVPTGNWSVKIEEPDHPLTRAFAGKGFVVHDEIYEMGEPFTRADRRVLLSLDISDPAIRTIIKGGVPKKEATHRADLDFAAAWIKHYGAGRVFYGVFGHLPDPFQNPAILQFYLDGIQYVLGDLVVDDTPRTARK